MSIHLSLTTPLSVTVSGLVPAGVIKAAISLCKYINSIKSRLKVTAFLVLYRPGRKGIKMFVTIRNKITLLIHYCSAASQIPMPHIDHPASHAHTHKSKGTEHQRMSKLVLAEKKQSQVFNM